jgi:hypothetical protein
VERLPLARRLLLPVGLRLLRKGWLHGSLRRLRLCTSRWLGRGDEKWGGMGVGVRRGVVVPARREVGGGDDLVLVLGAEDVGEEDFRFDV